MIIKDKLHLMQNSPNVFDYPQTAIDTVKISDDDMDIFISTLKLITPKMKTSISKKYVDFHIQSTGKYLDIVKLKSYPLVSVYNSQTRRGIINLSVLATRDISNINSRDLFALTTYMHTCSIFSSGTKISKEYITDICDYYTSFLLNSFSKRYGLTGAYQNEIPKFKLLTFLYIYRAFFGVDINSALNEISRLVHLDPSVIKIDYSKYDFSEVNDFLKALNDSQITPGLSLYRFVDSMIKMLGVMNLGFFEDCMRFACTMFSSSVDGNTIFPLSLGMINPKQYRKVIDIIDVSLRKSI